MELTGLLPVLAWLQILPRLVSSKGTEGPSSSPGPLLPPTLSLGSQYPVYYQGEQVNLSCSAPHGEAVTGYRFYRGRGDQTPEELPSPSRAAWLELRAETGNQGPYTCQYWRKESGQEIPSAESNKVYITVQAPPAAPTLSLHPAHPLYLPGERVTLRCSAPGGDKLQGYRFYEEQEGLIHDEVPAPAGGARLEIVAKMGKAGVYTCAYWIPRSGRHIPSERSQPVSLSVQAPPEAPSLFLSPPHPVYLPGESVTLTCSPPRGAPVAAEFQFSRDGGQKISSRSRDVHALSITGPEDSGSYTCVYWIHPFGRKIQSPGSRPVSIAVTAPPPAPRLSLDTPNTVYLAGERLNLSCSAPGAQEVTGYRFYKRPPEQSSEELPSPQRGPRLEILAAVGDEASYTCQYWSREFGRELPSGLSQPIAIRVTELPSAPQLALAPPHPVYVLGEWVTLRCSAPQGEGVTRYRFYRQRRGLIADGVPEPAGGAQLELRAEMGMAGLYVCAYWTLRAGREVPSGESRPISVSVIDPPRKPSVSLSPDYPAYVAGDRVEINCSAPPGALPVQYGLYEGREPLGPLPGNAGNWWMDLQANGARNATRSFSCTYIELIQGREVPSCASDAVSVSVFPAPAAPSLLLIPPLPLYVTGETVTAQCIVPAGLYVPRAHWVLRDGEALREQPEPQLPLNVSRRDSGTYRCGYSTELHGRHLRSPPSDPLPLSVTDPPPQPALSVDLPSRVVSEGLPLLITCMAPGDASERRFHFYKDGAELPPGDTGSEISTTEPSTGFMNFSVLSILRAGPSNTGEFSCEYEVNMSGRWIPSPRSQAVNVTVTAWSLPIPLVAGCSGAATALALLLLLIPLCRKKAAGA
ncbi:Fc receptor-like protein 5 isoform X1 [Gopherus flavomarginatus]|uniref:Fc receptor-like protein 5 isoform X1 n=1 Tax=Gopherus flavomarginatus TaxID=286002 RepID=UPI0021CBA245|nr:Fc receptor-like protein 5 isoform X1 [Gopherus flavomarginatus]XP_050774983.1 Fc receptor-like protein 5 isoform X2 [Gopherus flavomarginatus]XP_050774984.1 Fc receptor-like protein 5 isoform X1 [Gopherus flavomarginatus]